MNSHSVIRVLIMAMAVVAAWHPAASADCSWTPQAGTSIMYTNCTNVGINQSSAAWTLDVNGNIGVNGAPAVIRPSTNYDAQGLKFMGTQLVIGGLNERAYLYTGSALAFIGSWYDGTELLRLASYSNNGLISVTQTSIDSLNADFRNTLIHVVKSAPAALGPEIKLENSGAAVGDAEAITFSSNGETRAQIRSTVEGNPWRGTLEFYTGFGTLTKAMHITGSGQVGIGTSTPAAALDVTGNIRATGTTSAASVIGAVYQDVAEWVPASEAMAAGSVVVIDTAAVNGVAPSRVPYDTMVAGVISAQPGVLLGTEGASKVKVATTGRVPVRVDAGRGAVRTGDLLVTSDKPGVAMRSEPVEFGGVKMHRPGTIIGKALEPLPSGEGEILVLLSLQ